MLDELKGLVSQITEKQGELKKTTDDIIAFDEKRLETVVNIALGGLEFDKIWSVKRSINATENEITPIEYEYLKKDNNTYLKGIKVGQYKGEHYSTDVCCEQEDVYELWLTPNQFIVTHVTGSTSNGQWGKSNLKRELIKADADPFEINDDLEYVWDIDGIINSIINNLKNRADNLSYRLVKQKDRLEKLRQLQI